MRGWISLDKSDKLDKLDKLDGKVQSCPVPMGDTPLDRLGQVCFARRGVGGVAKPAQNPEKPRKTMKNRKGWLLKIKAVTCNGGGGGGLQVVTGVTGVTGLGGARCFRPWRIRTYLVGFFQRKWEMSSIWWGC